MKDLIIQAFDTVIQRELAEESEVREEDQAARFVLGRL